MNITTSEMSTTTLTTLTPPFPGNTSSDLSKNPEGHTKTKTSAVIVSLCVLPLGVISVIILLICIRRFKRNKLNLRDNGLMINIELDISDITRMTAKQTGMTVIGATEDTGAGTSSFINSINEVNIGNSCFSDNRSSTRMSNVHQVISSSREEPGQPELVELNTLTQELDAQASHFDKYTIDVAGLPAYTYSRISIQDIERKCRKHLTKTRFSERDREAFLSKDVHLFSTVGQHNKFKFATSMDCRIEMKDIANTISCTYAPCIFIIEYKQVRTIAHIFEELQKKGLEFCVLILGHKSWIDDMQTLHKRLVAFASESDMQDAVDDLFERFSFSVLRKLSKSRQRLNFARMNARQVILMRRCKKSINTYERRTTTVGYLKMSDH